MNHGELEVEVLPAGTGGQRPSPPRNGVQRSPPARHGSRSPPPIGWNKTISAGRNRCRANYGRPSGGSWASAAVLATRVPELGGTETRPVFERVLGVSLGES